MDGSWSIGWDRCLTLVLALAGGHGISTYLASRHTEDPDRRSEAWRKGLLAPLSLYSGVGRFYKWLSYGFAAAVLIAIGVCYLSPNPFSSLGLRGFELGLTLFLICAGAAITLSWTAHFLYREENEQTRSMTWSWAWDPPSLTSRGERLRFIAGGLIGLGFLAMLLSVVFS